MLGSAAGGRAGCVICGGTSFVPQFGKTDTRRSRETPQGPYRITHSQRHRVGFIERCAGCGMIVLPPDAIVPMHYGEGEDLYYVEQAEARIANAHHLLSLVEAGGRLLDVGCAYGFLLVAARERGFQVEGVELSQRVSEEARRRFGLDVKTGALEEVHLAAESYDVVVLADVIEHLTDPRATVREIHRLLRSGGRLLILTPDIGSLVARVAGRRWWGIIDDHYFYFSRQTLRRLLESEGFAVEHCGPLGRRFPLAHWIFKLSQYSSALHRVVDGAMGVLGVRDVQVSINLGDMMACVARKK